MIRHKVSFLFLIVGLVSFTGNLRADEATPAATAPTDNATQSPIPTQVKAESPLRKAMDAAGALAAAGKTDEAIAAYEKIGVLRSHKADSWRLNNEGLAYLGASTNQADKAIPVLEKAVAEQPSNAVAWNNLGIAYERTGVLDKAQDAYQKSVDASKADNSNSDKAEENLKTLQDEMATQGPQVTPTTQGNDASATPAGDQTSSSTSNTSE